MQPLHDLFEAEIVEQAVARYEERITASEAQRGAHLDAHVGVAEEIEHEIALRVIKRLHLVQEIVVGRCNRLGELRVVDAAPVLDRAALLHGLLDHAPGVAEIGDRIEIRNRFAAFAADLVDHVLPHVGYQEADHGHVVVEGGAHHGAGPLAIQV